MSTAIIILTVANFITLIGFTIASFYLGYKMGVKNKLKEVKTRKKKEPLVNERIEVIRTKEINKNNPI